MNAFPSRPGENLFGFWNKTFHRTGRAVGARTLIANFFVVACPHEYFSEANVWYTGRHAFALSRGALEEIENEQ